MDNKINTGIIRTAAFLGALSVALGAFAAHGLKERVSEDAYSIFEVGVRYQVYHVFAMALTALLFPYGNRQRLKLAARLFLAGIILFSGSLYALTFAVDAANPDFLKLGIITPFGGVCFIAGWLLVAFAFKPGGRQSGQPE